MREYLASVTKMFLGLTGARVIALVSMPVIARIYSPVDYGVFGVTLSAVTLATIISSLQLQQAIILPASFGGAIRLARVTCLGSAIGGVAVFLLCVLYFGSHNSPLENYLVFSILAGLLVSISGLVQALRALSARSRAFGAIGKSDIVRAIVVAAGQIIFGLMSYGSSGLLLGFLVGEISVATALTLSVTKNRAIFSRRVAVFDIFPIMKKYREFWGFGMPQELLSSSSQTAPILLLGLFFGPAVSGLYAFSIRVVLAPVQLVAGAMRDVTYQRFARLLTERDKLEREYRQITLALLAVSASSACLIAGFMPDIFEVVFGSEWRESGRYASWLVFWATTMLVIVPSTLIFRVLRQQKESLKINVLIFLSRVGVLVVGGMAFSGIVTVGAFSVVAAVWNFILIGAAWKRLSSWCMQSSKSSGG